MVVYSAEQHVQNIKWFYNIIYKNFLVISLVLPSPAESPIL